MVTLPKKVNLDNIGWQRPPDPTEKGHVGTLFEPKKEPGFLATINGMVKLWKQQRPPGIRPKYLYMPSNMERILNDEISALKGAPVTRITKLQLSVGWVQLVIFQPREGPRFVLDDSSLFLK